MRNRLEDFGRLLVLLENIIEIPLMDFHYSPKHDIDRFLCLEKELQEELIHKIYYDLEQIQEKLYECVLIAKCQDDLNSTEF